MDNNLQTAGKAAEAYLETLKADAISSLVGPTEFADFNVELMRVLIEGRKLDFRDHAELMGAGVEISGVLSMLSTTINRILAEHSDDTDTVEEGTSYLARCTTGAVARAMYEGAVFAARHGLSEKYLQAMCPQGRAGW